MQRASKRQQEIDREIALEQYRRKLAEATKQLEQWEDEGGWMIEEVRGDWRERERAEREKRLPTD